MKGLGCLDILAWLISIPLDFIRSVFGFVARIGRK